MKKNKLAKILIIILIVICVLVGVVWFYLFGMKSGKTVSGNNATEHVGFYVDGTKLMDVNGNEFVMRGINHAHCWYTSEDVKAFDAIKDTGANCIRIVCANGIQWNSDTAVSISRLIEMAKERELIAILEVHDGTGSDDIGVLENIAEFWISLKDVLAGTESYCIVNIANEWCGSWNSKTWKDGYLNVIPKIREAGIENLLMVDAGGWGQYGHSIIEYGYDVFMSDPLANTMFSVHMYGTSGGSQFQIKYNLEGATEQNLCVCVGEFGYTHSDGDVDEDFLMKYCEENSIGYLAWSWKGNSGGVEYLDLSNDWEGKNLSPLWGDKVVNGDYGLKKTSEKCSVFN